MRPWTRLRLCWRRWWGTNLLLLLRFFLPQKSEFLRSFEYYFRLSALKNLRLLAWEDLVHGRVACLALTSHSTTLSCAFTFHGDFFAIYHFALCFAFYAVGYCCFHVWRGIKSIG